MTSFSLGEHAVTYAIQIDFIFLLLCHNDYDYNHAFQARCYQKVPLL